MGEQNNISKINFERIDWCCKDIDIDLSNLAKELKIPLLKLKKGPLTYNQLAKISHYFGYTPLFFLNQNLPNKEKIHSLAFRTLTKSSVEQTISMDAKLVKLIKKVEWHRDLYISLLEDLDDLTIFKQPTLSGSSKDKAQQVREWLGLSVGKSYNYSTYRELIEKKNIFVIQSMGYNGQWKLHHENVAGFSLMHNKIPTIFIKKTSIQMQSFTLFHELAHILLHSKTCIDKHENFEPNASDHEREANEFAGYCLLPDECLKGLSIPNNPSDYHTIFSDLAKKFGISVGVIVVALAKQKRLTWEQYSEYKSEEEARYKKSQQAASLKPSQIIPRTYRHREPLHIMGKNYVGKVLEAYHEGLITLSKASNHLDKLSVSNIKKLQEDF